VIAKPVFPVVPSWRKKVKKVKSYGLIPTMTFKSEISLGDIIAAAGFLVAALGLFLTLCQLRRDSVRKRAEFIISVFNQYVTDPDTSQIFYLIEYEGFHYGPKFHHSEQERRLDRLLSYFEKIAALYSMGVIRLEDLELVRYEFLRVYKNRGVQDYFRHLDTLPKAIGVSGGTFQKFRDVADLLADSEKP
jgi:hypothetical protein